MIFDRNLYLNYYTTYGEFWPKLYYRIHPMAPIRSNKQIPRLTCTPYWMKSGPLSIQGPPPKKRRLHPAQQVLKQVAEARRKRERKQRLFEREYPGQLFTESTIQVRDKRPKNSLPKDDK